MKKLNLILLATVALALPATANIILSDAFSYPEGDLVGALGSPWVAHDALGSNPVIVTNEEMRIVHGSGSREDVNAALAGAPYATDSGATLYASFKARFTALPTTNGAYFAHFRDTASGFRCRLWASATNAAPGTFRLSVANTSGDNPSMGQFPQDLSLDVVYTVVTRYELGTGISTLWINPSAETDTNVTPAQTTGPISISTYAFRQASGGGTCFIDDLKVGTSFNDMAGANNPPTISAMPNQTIPMDGSVGPLSFTVGDAETPATDLNVTKLSSNPTLVPEANIVISGTGSDRTVTVTPAAGQQGTAAITLTVTDGDGASTSTVFSLFVGYPSISSIPRQIIVTNTSTGPVPFVIGDAETPAADLTLTVSSFDTNLIPVANILFGGSASNRTVTVTPAADQSGYSTLTVVVSDGTLTATNRFTVTVRPQVGLLINEPFNYADDTALVGGTLDWINHSGTYGQTKVYGGKALMTFTNDEDFNREFIPLFFPPTNGWVLYSSFKVNFSQLPSSAGSYFAHYKDDSTLNFRSKVFACTQEAQEGALRLGITLNLSSIGTNALHPTAIATNTEHTVVTRYDLGTGWCTLWIDPVDENDVSVSAPDSTSAITVYSFAFRQAAGIGTFTVDDLKIGTSFADVAERRYRLEITRVGENGVEISWPAAATGYVLQHATGVLGEWQPYADQGSPSGGRMVVSLTGVSGNAFFRLAKPLP